MMRKTVLLVAVVVLALGLSMILAGCGGPATATNGTNVPSASTGGLSVVGKWTHDTGTPWAGVVEVTFDADGGAQFGEDPHRFRWSGTGSSYTFTGFVGNDGFGFKTVPPFTGQLGADGQLYVSGFPNPELNGYWQRFVPAGGG